jgi:mRNA interferase MazF
MHPRRSEVWWVAFDPSIGGEIQKTRPALIVSNNAANTALNRVIVVPLTSQTAKVYPGEALVTVNGEQRKAMADQLTTASKKRLRSKLGELSSADVNAVESAILLQLGIRR